MENYEHAQFWGFYVIHCGITELNYVKHSFNNFKAV